MGHHHHLLPFLALTLLILVLQSSSITGQTTPALFSLPSQYLAGGQNLTDGKVTLSLSNDCGLVLYEDGEALVDFNTSTKASFCNLRISLSGQLVLDADDEQVPIQTICNANTWGYYALLFVKGKLGIFGPAIWSNGVLPPFILEREKLKKGNSDNFLFSLERVNGTANGDALIARNGKVSAYITSDCTLLVEDDTTGTTLWQSSPGTAEPKDCFLSLSNVGQFLLQYKNGSELYTQWTGGDYVDGPNLYVAILRYFGRINIYGLKEYLYQCSSSVADAAAVAAQKNIKMVTA